MVELVLLVGLPWLIVRCVRAFHQGYTSVPTDAVVQDAEVQS
jgi:hypothetical protein